MQTQTELKDLFQYNITPILILLLIILIIILIIIFLYMLSKHKPKQQPNIQIVVPKNTVSIKDKYLSLINDLINKVNSNTITNRKAYQQLSFLIRNFIFEMTSIKVQNYTLRDIETLNMPYLEELVREYYSPEFAYNSTGNIIESINKTREVILKWQ